MAFQGFAVTAASRRPVSGKLGGTVAYDQGDQDSATTHLSTAYAWFKKLQMPRYVERTKQLAQDYGVTLTEVELEERMEGLP
jgi:hypothetical protein